MNADCVFQDLNADGTYSGRCTFSLDDPVGRVTGTATLRIGSNSKTEAEVSIEEFEAPPEYGENLLAFFNASPPKRQGEQTVVTIPVTVEERRITSLTVETVKGTFTASSGLLITPVFLGFGSKETLSLVLNDLAFSPHAGLAPKYWLIPLQGPFGEHYLKRAAPPHIMALEGEGISTFSANNLECGLQTFDASKRPSHSVAVYDALAFGEVNGSPVSLQEIWDAVPSGLTEALSFAVGADVTAPWIELCAADGSLVWRFYFHIGQVCPDYSAKVGPEVLGL